MKTKLVAVGFAIASSLLPIKAIAASYEGLNVFGDSLVDSGNLFDLTSAFSFLGVPGIPPSPPYAQKFSNGPIWIDQVGQSLGLSPRLSTQLLLNPTKPLPTQGINFAFGGALSSNLNVIDDDVPFLAGFLPGFQTQVDTFAAISAFAPPNPDALNVVWVGGNDYDEAFSNPASLGGLSLEQLPDSVTDNIVNGLTELSSLGAKKFLVVNLPSLGETPLADSLDTETQQDVSSLLNQLTATHNKLLSEKLGAFGQSHTDTNVTELDVNTLFSDLLANPSAFGLTNVTDPCLTDSFNVCDNPDQFLFWDDIHPTTAAYQIVSDFALASLENINENTAPSVNVLEPVSLTALSSTESPASVPEPTSLTALFIMGAVGSRALAKRERLKATSS